MGVCNKGLWEVRYSERERERERDAMGCEMRDERCETRWERAVGRGMRV